MNKASATALHAIKLVVLDVDGVLTDGRLYYGAGGEELKVFHVRDGLGLKQVMRIGLTVAVVSGRRTPAVDARCSELGITLVEQGCENKVEALERVCAQIGASPHEVLCVIDDTLDLPLARAVGFSVAVADAHAAVRDVTDRVTITPGGRGAVREVCDWILAAHGRT